MLEKNVMFVAAVRRRTGRATVLPTRGVLAAAAIVLLAPMLARADAPAPGTPPSVAPIGADPQMATAAAAGAPAAVQPAPAPGPYKLGAGDQIEVSFYRSYNLPPQGYLLDVGDVLSIVVEDHAELTAEAVVRPDGFISAALLGDVRAGGLTPEELREDLRTRYAEKIPRPMVTVVVKETQAKLNEFFKTLMSNQEGAYRVMTVRPDGMLSFPLLGEVTVTERTVDEVQRMLSDRYRGIFRYIDVSVNLQASAHQRVTILGEVTRPGVYPLSGELSVLQGVAMAGGFLETAQPQSVILIRQGPGPTYAGVKVDLKNVDQRTDLGYGPLLEARDIVFVPKSRIARVDKWIDQYIRKVIPFSVGFGVFVDVNH